MIKAKNLQPASGDADMQSNPSGADMRPPSGGAREPRVKGAKERFYDKIPLTARQLDIIIIALAALFIVVLTVGALVGNGYLPMLKF